MVVYQPSFEAFAGDVCTKWTPKKTVISARALIIPLMEVKKKLPVHKARLNPTYRSSYPTYLFLDIYFLISLFSAIYRGPFSHSIYN